MIHRLLWIGPFFIICLLIYLVWIFACAFRWEWFLENVSGYDENPLSLWWDAR